ncbi:MAG: dipeptide epimerase [Bacteroidetes bacterium]|nr:dipeptide epimerase [Bacteroidota bacterium]
MQLKYYPNQLEFKHPFKIALNARTSTSVVFVELKAASFSGYGEASLPPYLKENQASVEQYCKKAAVLLENYEGEINLNELLNVLWNCMPENYAAKAALDMAAHDLVGKISGRNIREIYGIRGHTNFPTFFTIGITDNEKELHQKLDEAKEYSLLKLKLGSTNDRMLVSNVRSYTDKPIAVDVNQGWKTKEEALDMIQWLQTKNVLFVEQPMNKKMLDEHGWLKEKSPLPIIADESLQTFDDLDVVANCFDGINIKLMKCGGIREAFKIITKARNLKLKILIGCMSETSCANSAAAVLAGLADWVDLDGPLLIKEDFFWGLNFSRGKIYLNDEPGLGVERQKLL